MKKLTNLIALIIICFDLLSQEPAIQWQNTIGGNAEDQLNQTIQTPDGGFISVGNSNSNISGDKTEAGFGGNDFWVVKTNALGVISWQKAYGGTGEDKGIDIRQTADGGYIIGGYSNSGISGNKTEPAVGSNDFWIIKTDGSGNIIWQNTIGGNGSDVLSALQITTDGGFIVAGYSGSGNSGDKTEPSNGGTDYWVIKLNSTGSITWQNGIGGTGADILRSIQQTTDGGYILGGYSSSPISGDKTEINNGATDFWLVKLNSTGNVLWQNIIGGDLDDQLNSVYQTAGGGYLLAGISNSNISFDKTEDSHDDNDYFDYWIIETNNIGNILWQEVIGGYNDDQLIKSVQTADGGILLAGHSSSDAFYDKLEPKIGMNDIWVMKLEAGGYISWQNVIGGNNQDYLTSIQLTADNGYILSGYSRSPASGDKTENVVGGTTSSDYWIIKLQPDNCIPVNYYSDIDEDLYGDLINVRSACEIPDGFILNNADCNDKNPFTNPSKPEICDGADNNCNGLIDEGLGACNPGPAIEWQVVIGGDYSDILTCANPTSDGGYILGGYSTSNNVFDKSESSDEQDYWVIKTNNSGDIIWQNTITGIDEDYLKYIEQTSDGGYICIGYSSSDLGGDKTEGIMGLFEEEDYWVIKLTPTGNIEWQNTIGGSGRDLGNVIHQTTDGGYIIGGSSYSGVGYDKTVERFGVYWNSDYWVIKLNSFNSIVWQKDFGGVGDDNLTDLIQTSDGGYLAAGYSNSPLSGNKSQENVTGDCCFSTDSNDYWIVKMDALGNKLWDKTIGGGYQDKLVSVIQTDDGGFLLGGYSSSDFYGDKTMDSKGSNDYWIVKTDALGNIQWQTNYGSSSYELLADMRKTSDGGYIIAGYSSGNANGDKTESSLGSHDYWIVKIDGSGNLIWQNSIGGDDDDEPSSIFQTADGGFLIGGNSKSGIFGDKTINCLVDEDDYYYNEDFWLVKLNGECLPLAETCNNLDDNCNGLIDDDITETINISAGGPTTFCQGGSVLLSATFSGLSVQWKKNGVNIPGATNSTYLANIKGTYSCETTSPCDVALSSPIIVNVLKNPNASITASGATTFCAGGSVTLTEAPVTGSTYQWYKGATSIAGATSTNYIATTAGNYKCRVTKTASGCFKNSNTISVTVPCKEGENLLDEENNDFTIFPNPNNGTFYISALSDPLRSLRETNQPCVLEIFNSHGQQIYSQQINSTDGNINETISVNNLSSGIYFVQLKSVNYYLQQKLIIE